MITMLLMSMSGMGRSISTVSMSLYIALIYARENVLWVSLIYALSSLLVSPTIEGLVTTIVPIVVMSTIRLITHRLHLSMGIRSTLVGAILSMIPLIVVTAMDREYMVYGIMNIIVTAIFTYLSIIAVFAVVVKRLRYRLTRDEIVSLLSLLVVMSMGVSNIDIYGFEVYYLLMPIIVLLATSVLELTPAILINTAYGIGGGIMSGNIELAGVILLMTLFSALFMRYNRYFSIVSIIAFDMVGGTYLATYPVYDYLHLIALCAGCVLYICIPKKWLAFEKNIYSREGRSTALVSFINRNRIDVVARITALAGIFEDIEAEMTGNEYILTQNGAERYLAERIMMKTCVECPNRATCFRALGGDTLSEIVPIVTKATLGKASRDDVGTFLESRCSRINEIVTLAADYTAKYAKRAVHICNVVDNKRVLGEQIGSIGRAIGRMADGMLEGVSEDRDLEERIREELTACGVALHDVLAIDRRSGGREITLVVATRDKDKRIIRDRLESLTRLRLTRSQDRCCELEGFSTIRYVPKCQYRLTYGIGKVTKEGSSESGDTSSITRLDDRHIAVILLDGKGSGVHAGENSSNTTGIIEKLYRAGFDSDSILSFANSLLSIRNSEDFTALDMCILDMQTASIDFVKLGGVTTYIRRSQSVEMIEGSSLPLGILEEATPSIHRRALGDEDIVVIVSDGVTDSIGDAGVKDILMNRDTSNVQKIADDIAMASSMNGAIDDITAIALRLVRDK